MGIQRFLHGLRRVGKFITEDVWDLDLGSLTAWRGMGVRAVRVIHLVFKGFRDDECPLHASALTFSSLMAVVPVLALSLALLRGFGDADTARDKVRGLISEWTQTFGASTNAPAAVSDGTTNILITPVTMVTDPGAVFAAEFREDQLALQIDSLVEGAFEKVESISFATLGSVGLILLLGMVIQMVGRVEAAFNRVWGVTSSRTLWRKFTDYLSVLIVLPLLGIGASSIQIADFASRFLDPAKAEMLNAWLDSAALKGFTVLGLSTIAFAFIITFVPNTNVKFRAALAGGIVSALLFVLWLKVCAALQVGVGRYGKIYGGFAVVPIVLAWVYVSWQIVLFGAEVAFAVQNCTTFRMEQGSRRASVESRLLLALSLVVSAARAMKGGDRGVDLDTYAKREGVPVRFVNEMADVLVQAGLFAELSGETGRFVLLRSPDSLTPEQVSRLVLRHGAGPESLGLDHTDPAVHTVLQRMLDAATAGPGATVADLVAREAKTVLA